MKRIVSEVLELLGDIVVPLIVTIILYGAVVFVMWLFVLVMLPKE